MHGSMNVKFIVSGPGIVPDLHAGILVTNLNSTYVTPPRAVFMFFTFIVWRRCQFPKLQTEELVGMEHSWNVTDKESRRCRRKTCLSVILPTKNPIWTGLAWSRTRPPWREFGYLLHCVWGMFFMYTIFRDLTGLAFQVVYCHLGARARYVIFLFLVVISVIWGWTQGFFNSAPTVLTTG
jgi:hypothetical protein